MLWNTTEWTVVTRSFRSDVIFPVTSILINPGSRHARLTAAFTIGTSGIDPIVMPRRRQSIAIKAIPCGVASSRTPCHRTDAPRQPPKLRGILHILDASGAAALHAVSSRAAIQAIPRSMGDLYRKQRCPLMGEKRASAGAVPEHSRARLGVAIRRHKQIAPVAGHIVAPAAIKGRAHHDVDAACVNRDPAWVEACDRRGPLRLGDVPPTRLRGDGMRSHQRERFGSHMLQLRHVENGSVATSKERQRGESEGHLPISAATHPTIGARQRSRRNWDASRQGAYSRPTGYPALDRLGYDVPRLFASGMEATMTNDDADRIAKQVAEWQGIVPGTETESSRDAWTEVYESQDFEGCSVIAAELMRRGEEWPSELDPAEERARINAEIAEYEASEPTRARSWPRLKRGRSPNS